MNPQTPVIVSCGAVCIRPAQKTDLSRVAAIEQSSFETVCRFSVRRLKYLLGCSTAINLVADRANTVVGFLLLLIRRQRHTRTGRIYDLAVDPDYRGMGTGKLLLEEAINTCRRLDIRDIRLEVACTNTAAIRMYEEHGFATICTLAAYYGANCDGLRMRLLL